MGYRSKNSPAGVEEDPSVVAELLGVVMVELSADVVLGVVELFEVVSSEVVSSVVVVGAGLLVVGSLAVVAEVADVVVAAAPL